MGAECAWDGGLDQSSEVIPGVRAFTDLIQTHKRLKLINEHCLLGQINSALFNLSCV